MIRTLRIRHIALAAVALLVSTGVSATDVLTTSDGTIISSLCVGFDCTSSESFGFDTVRLKENNTQIHFEDTSIGSFPTRDWLIQANSTSNGGQSYLRFQDVDAGRAPFTVEGDAPANSLYVESDGQVGLGTSNPAVELHTVDGDTPTLRLEQNGSSGFTPQTWDVAGNETNFFVRDVTNGSQLPFKIQPGADSDSLVIADDNNIGIGTLNPSQKLHVMNGDLKVEQSGAGDNSTIELATANSSWEIVQNGATGRLTFSSPGGAAITAPFKFSRDAQENLLRVGIVAGDTVDINGKLVINGTEVTPDYVFEPDYPLETIEEHADRMWENGHLPGLTSARQNEESGVDIVQHQFGVLEELEKAHIYIHQLNTMVAELRGEVAELKRQQQTAGGQSRHAHAEQAAN